MANLQLYNCSGGWITLIISGVATSIERRLPAEMVTAYQQIQVTEPSWQISDNYLTNNVIYLFACSSLLYYSKHQLSGISVCGIQSMDATSQMSQTNG